MPKSTAYQALENARDAGAEEAVEFFRQAVSHLYSSDDAEELEQAVRDGARNSLITMLNCAKVELRAAQVKARAAVAKATSPQTPGPGQEVQP